MIDHDRIFKELIKTFFVEFVELFLPDVYVDIDQGSIFPRRMFTYFARLHERHSLPVYPVVVFSYDTPLRPEPDFYRVEFPGFTVLEFNFRVIQLNRLNWRDFLNHQNPVARALMAKMRMEREERTQVKLECLRLMLTLKLNPAKMQMIAGFVNTYLRLSEEGEKWVVGQLADLIPKEANMEWITPWHTVGMIEGRMEEAVTLLLRMFKQRFGSLGKDIEPKLRTLSLPQIEELGVAFVDFRDVDELTRWLDEHVKNGPFQPSATHQTEE